MKKEKLKQFHDKDKKELSFKNVTEARETRGALHFDLVNKSIILADNIYMDWRKRETDESKERKKMVEKVWLGIIIQFVIVIILLIADGVNLLEIDSIIFVSFFGAIIIQFISLLLVAAKYLYDERTTESLKIMEKLMITTISHNADFPPEFKKDKNV